MRAIAWKSGRNFTAWHLRDGSRTLCGIDLEELRATRSECDSADVQSGLCKTCRAKRSAHLVVLR